MTKSTWLAFSALAACGALFACSSGSNNGGGGAYTSCLASQLPSACVTCVENSCGSQLSGFESSCSDFLSCVCPDGSYSASAAMSSTCQQKVPVNSPCSSAASSIDSCEASSCASQCSTSSSSSGGSSGGSSGSGSSSGGVGTMACGVSFNAASCASCVNTSCCSVTQTCANDSACIGILTCIKACASGDTTCQNACVSNASSTAQSEVNAMANCWSTSCSAAGC